MRKSFSTVTVAAVTFLLLTAGHAAADTYSSTIADFKKASVTKKFFDGAYAYAVFPKIGKGGLGVGVAYGKGKAYRNNTFTGFSEMSQGSIGFQAGGQVYSEIIFFQDKRAYEHFTSGNFEFGAEASAVAITAGAQAKAGSTGASASANKNQADIDYRNGIAVFTLTRGGLMYEAAVKGQKFSFTPK